jgi:hypothetical protein
MSPARAAKQGPKSLCLPDAVPTFDPKLSFTLPPRRDAELANPVEKDAPTLHGETRQVRSCSTDSGTAVLPAGLEVSKQHKDNETKRLHPRHGC